MDAEAKPKICGTCAHWLPNRLKEPDPLARKWCLNHEVDAWTEDEHTCPRHLGADALECNVPNHLRNPTMTDPNPNPVDGPTELMIVTFGTPTQRCTGLVVSDLDWLKLSLQTIRKHCQGFQGVTVVHPRHESKMFKPLIAEFGVRLHAFDEQPGKGFLGHEIQMGSADKIVPPGTKYVLHSDSDCLFRMRTTPEHYFAKDKPYYIVRSWESLTTEDPNNPGSKVVSDCEIWRLPTDEQLGFATEVYAMCMNTCVFPIDFYAKYRAHIESVHRRPFEQYMLEGVNSHPCSRMDFTTMGAFAYHKMRDRFTWFHVEKGGYPADRKLAMWSHKGIDDEAKKYFNQFMLDDPSGLAR